MIDWNYNLIQTINDHYNTILNPGINLNYFIRNFEQIYRTSIADEVILPDIFQDVMCYTFNGINAKDKLILSSKEEEILDSILIDKRLEQTAKRQEAIEKSMDEYYKFMIEEVLEFVDKYPYWSELIIERK